ncbi:MAG TPA: GNAT family N-acetyltransferase [Anaerolineales bacterium]|nr:GNAT family N-acetyltransferase [Anaerolineales bacterium]
MSDNTKILVRNAREQDIPAVLEIEAETASQTATAQEGFQQRMRVFPNGFIILVADNEIAGFGCSEKWLDEHEQQPDLTPMATHQPDGRIFFITALAVKKKFQGRGYRSVLLEKLIETAHLEGCRKVMLETARDQDLYLERGFKTVQNRNEHGKSLDRMALDLAFISRIP